MPKATNAERMKHRNKKLVLDLIRRAPISRVDIARRTGLTKASVTIIADELLREDAIFESEGAPSGVGRRPISLAVRADSRYAVGVDITRRSVTLGLTDLGGNVRGETKFPTDPDSGAALQKIARDISRILQQAAPGHVLGIGVCTPGPVDYRRGMVLNPPGFRAWHNLPLARELSKATGLPVRLENVSNGRALAEQYFGGAEGNFMAVVIDEGIGSGIVIDGRPYRGANGLGSEIGHTSIRFDGIPCECGNIGCLEKYASMQSLLGTRFPTWETAVDSGDTSLLEQEALYLSIAFTNAVNLFDLDKIVLCGDISGRPEVFLPILRRHMQDKPITRRSIAISASKINSGVLIGAANIIDSYFSCEAEPSVRSR